MFVVASNGSCCVRKDILSVQTLSGQSMRPVWKGFESHSNQMIPKVNLKLPEEKVKVTE